MKYYDNYLSEHFDKRETLPDIGAVKDKIEFTPLSGICSVGLGDAAVEQVNDFLLKLDLFTLADRLMRTVRDGRLYRASYDIGAPYGAIAVNIGDAESEPRQIIEQLFRMYEPDMLSGDMDAVKSAFDVFVNEGDIFIPREHLNYTLISALSDLDASLKRSASNEGGINLHPSAYTQMIDLSDITGEDLIKKDWEEDKRRNTSVVEEVTNTFTHVAEHYMDELNKLLPEGKKLALRDMPGVKEKLIVKRLSNGVIPTAISTGNGVIIINENFMKLLFKFYSLGIYQATIIGERGDSSKFDEYGEKPQFLGNFYKSLLYSIALHEIRGHSILKDEVLVYNADEAYAQKERGDRTYYSNFLAVLIYWLLFVEDESRILELIKGRHSGVI